MKKLMSTMIRQMALLHRQATRFLRVTYFRLKYPNCQFAKGVKICDGVQIQVTGGGSVSIGANAVIRENCVIVVKKGSLIVGRESFIGWGSVICANESIEIGDNALIAEYVSIRDQNHGISISEKPFAQQRNNR